MLQDNILTLAIAGKIFAIWLGILVMAVVNGMLRETVLIPSLGQVAGFILCGVLLSFLILAITYLALPWLGRWPPARYIGMGFGWLFLTLAFELTFGSIIQGKPWSQLFEAYTFKDGNIWPIVLLATGLAPYIAAKLRGLA